MSSRTHNRSKDAEAHGTGEVMTIGAVLIGHEFVPAYSVFHTLFLLHQHRMTEHWRATLDADAPQPPGCIHNPSPNPRHLVLAKNSKTCCPQAGFCNRSVRKAYAGYLCRRTKPCHPGTSTVMALSTVRFQLYFPYPSLCPSDTLGVCV